MAKFACLLLCLAVIVDTGFSLKCYHCNSDKIDGCLKSANPKEQPCGNTVQGQKAVCFYKESRDDAKKTVSVNASCALIAATVTDLKTLPECNPSPGMSVKECNVCQTDLCNSATAFTSSVVSLLCLPALYLVVKLLH